MDDTFIFRCFDFKIVYAWSCYNFLPVERYMASGDITRTYAFIPKCIDYFLFFKVNNVKMTMNPDPDESAKHTRYYSSRAPDITVHSSVKRV